MDRFIRDYCRLDVSWERETGSRQFVLAVELEFDRNWPNIREDLNKLVTNTTSENKVMVCQRQKLETAGYVTKNVGEHIAGSTGTYLLPI